MDDDCLLSLILSRMLWGVLSMVLITKSDGPTITRAADRPIMTVAMRLQRGTFGL
jgi:hypothetical protein